MTTIIKIDGTQSTLTIEYSAIKEKVNATAEDAVHCLFDRDFLGSEIELVRDGNGMQIIPEWKDVTNAQKLSILDDYVKKTILGLAKEYYLSDAKQAAQISAETTMETRYIEERLNEEK